MKKSFTLLCLVAMVSAGMAQGINKALDYASLPVLKPVSFTGKGKHQGQPQAQSGRAATISLGLDYDGNDREYANLLSATQTGVRWNVNSKFTNTDNFNLDYAVTYYDTLQYVDVNDNNTIKFIPRAAATITLDSFDILFEHKNTTGNNDSIRFTVFRSGAETITGYGTPGATFTTPSLWDTLIVTNTTIPVDAQLGVTDLTFYPNLTFAKGETFGIRADYVGDTANTFEMFASYRDNCGDACVGEISVAGNNAGYYLNITQTTNNLSGYFENDDRGAIFFDCNQDNAFTEGACENFYIQNWFMPAFITAEVDFGVAITADSLRGCPGTTINLAATGYGSDGNQYTYEWGTNNGSLTSTSDQQVGLVIGNADATVTVTVTDATNTSLTATSTIKIVSRGINVSFTGGSNPTVINCGGTGTIVSTISGYQTGKKYAWSTGNPADNKATLTVSSAGNYTVTVTNNAGCSASATKVVEYPGISNYTVSFTLPASPVCEDRSLTFTNTSGRQSGWSQSWDFGDNNVSFLTNGVNTYAAPGVYPVTLTQDSAGCIFKSQSVNLLVLRFNDPLCLNSGVEDVTFAGAVSLMPNPTNGNVSVSVNGVEKNLSIRVYNVLGSELKSFNLNETSSNFTKTFDFSDLASGTYLVKIQTADKTAVKRLTISK